MSFASNKKINQADTAVKEFRVLKEEVKLLKDIVEDMHKYIALLMASVASLSSCLDVRQKQMELKG